MKWEFLKEATKELLPAAKMLNKELKAALAKYDDAAVLRVIEALRNNKPIPREPLRTAEYKQFLAQEQEIQGQLPGQEDLYYARIVRPGHGLPPKISTLVLAHRLRELRVQVGFTRLEPITANLQGEYDLQVRTAALSQTEKWLPATEIRGEGFFFVLDEAAVVAWENSAPVQKRGLELLKGYQEWSRAIPEPPKFPGVRESKRADCWIRLFPRRDNLRIPSCSHAGSGRPSPVLPAP